MKGPKVLLAIVAVGAVIVALVVFLISRGLETAPETVQVAESFIGHLSSADYQGAYALTAADLQSEYTQDDLRIFVEDRQSLFTEQTTISLTQRGVENDVRYAAGTLSSGDTTVPLYMEFVDDGGETRVIYFSFLEEDIPPTGQ